MLINVFLSFSQLLCKFEPDSVLTFLKSFEDYRLEHCLKLCQEHGITDAAAYLFERVGDVGSALSLALSSVDLHIHEMDLSVARLFVQNMNVNSVDTEKIEQCLTIPEVLMVYRIAFSVSSQIYISFFSALACIRLRLHIRS
jgi:hypothetical protein